MQNKNYFDQFIQSSLMTKIVLAAVVLIWSVVFVLLFFLTTLFMEQPSEALQATAVVTTPAIGLSPAAASAGSTVTIEGEGWQADSKILIYLVGTDSPSYAISSAEVDSSGHFTVDFIFPSDPRWAGQPTLQVLAQAENGSISAQALLMVVSTPEPPTATPTASPSATGTPTEVVQTPTAIIEAPTATSLPASAQATANTNMNVRSGPGVNYEIIGTVVGGELLPIIGRSSDGLWYNVQTVFGAGWVSARYLITRNEFGNAPVTEDTVDENTYIGPVAIVNAGALNIRSGPGAGYTILGRAVGGDQFVILARDAAFLWIQIDTDFGEGWVNRNYIIIRGDVSSLPTADATTAITVRDPATGDTTVSTPTLIGPVAFVATGALNIRSGPNISFSSLGSVPSTTRMPIIGQSPDRRWWKVESPFGGGWVNKNYVLVEGDASNVPVVSQ